MNQNRYENDCDFAYREDNACDCGCEANVMPRDHDIDYQNSCQDDMFDYGNDGCCQEDMGWCPQSIGPTGPMGPRGPRGAQGPRGLQGQQGREGLQGIRGPQGVTGAQGVPGMQGATGPTGPRGLPGKDGINGITGATGARGATGAMGVPGPQGPQGNTGPAGESAPIISYASASLTSYTPKTVCAQDAVVFDSGTIHYGFTISPDYTSLIAQQEGTYIIEYGFLASTVSCEGDAMALELNNQELIEESRMPILCENTFVRGSVLFDLQAEDSIRLVCDTADAINSCSIKNTVNAYLVIYQVR